MIRGANLRLDHHRRIAIVQAHLCARLMRARKIPPVRRLLGEDEAPREMRSPSEQTWFLREWARQAQAKGLAVRIGRRDDPPPNFKLKDPAPGPKTPPKQRLRRRMDG